MNELPLLSGINITTAIRTISIALDPLFTGHVAPLRVFKVNAIFWFIYSLS